MMFRSIALSCSLLGFLANGAAMAMDLKEGDARNTPSQKQGVVADDSGSAPKGGAAAPSREMRPFKKRFPSVLEGLIAQRVVFWQGLENKGSTNIALVCKDWSKTVKQEMEVNKPGWMAWYGIVGDRNKETYKRFLQGTLLYRPNPASNEGMITLRIADLLNPLEGTFDLSQCGKSKQSLSISTGFRKVQNPANANKVEIWFTPWFLADKKMSTLAENHHLRAITKGGNWDGVKAPIGIFWTGGGWNATSHMPYCDYLTTESMDLLGSENLYEKYISDADSTGSPTPPVPTHVERYMHFTFRF